MNATVVIIGLVSLVIGYIVGYRDSLGEIRAWKQSHDRQNLIIEALRGKVENLKHFERVWK